jgi:SAM-dependent methyltransferase
MTTAVREIDGCEVCGGASLAPVLGLGLHPLCDDLVPIGDPRVCRQYPIDIVYCDTCRTAHQRYQVPRQELFPKSYHYRSRFTADVLQGMAGLVRSCRERFGPLTGKRVLDIGCNDGSLLDVFRQEQALTLGIEPTDACRDAAGRGHATYQGYLSEELAETVCRSHGAPDIITFTNVFAHIEDLDEVIRSLQRLMAPGTVAVIENHYLGAVLKHNQFDTFYHEHPRTYSATSFLHIARALGRTLSGIEFPSRYGGNIRVYIGGAGTGEVPIDVRRREERFLLDFAGLGANLERWRKRRKATLEAMAAEHGRLRAKAFPGRAAILVKLLDLDESLIEAVYEKPGSMKIGHYLPGTRIPIRSDTELFALPDRSLPILNLAWHIAAEIRDYLSAHGYRGEVHDIVRADDFAER